MLSIEGSLHEPEVVHFEAHNQDREKDSFDLINLNSEHSIQRGSFSSIESNSRNGELHVNERVVNDVGEPQDGSLSSGVRTVRETCGNGTEAVYCTIVDITSSDQTDSGTRSKEIKAAEHASPKQVSNFISSGTTCASNQFRTGVIHNLEETQDSDIVGMTRNGEVNTEFIYCEIMDMTVTPEVVSDLQLTEFQQLDCKASLQASVTQSDLVSSVSKKHLQADSYQVRVKWLLSKTTLFFIFGTMKPQTLCFLMTGSCDKNF